MACLGHWQVGVWVLGFRVLAAVCWVQSVGDHNEELLWEFPESGL